MDSSYFLSYKRFFNANHPTFCPGNQKKGVDIDSLIVLFYGASILNKSEVKDA